MTVAQLSIRAFKGLVRLSALGCKTGPHMVRYQMYQEVRRALADVRAPGGTVLDVSHSTALADLISRPDKTVTEVFYPAHDLRHSYFPDDSWDYVVCDQILEHVCGNPQIVIDETRRILKPGGIAIHTTCLLQELHQLPYDYWRFTPNGLAYLCRNFSRIVAVGGWGNRLAHLAFRYFDVPEATWHPLHKIATYNSPEAPITTWIVAQK